jgi:LuxR family transcriptional regulator, quorum-sensing system regulator BjaR1
MVDARRYGLIGVGAQWAKISAPSTEEDILYAGLSTGWMEYYLEQNYISIDPIFALVDSAIVPFTWTQTGEACEPDHPGLRVLAEAREAGLPEGLVLPVDGAGGYKGFVSFSSDCNEIDPQANLDMHLISIHFHNRMRELLGRQLQTPNSTISLMPIEMECLLWLSEGKSDWEIGAILSKSERTIRTHVQALKSRLNARTRVQTVAEAVHRGLIDPCRT